MTCSDLGFDDYGNLRVNKSADTEETFVFPSSYDFTGYTGELGYEIFCHPKDADAVWDAVWAAGQDQGLRPMGLIVGIFALTFIASNAGDEFNFKEVTVLASILAVISYAAFILLLKLQFPVWPAFLTA